MAVAFLFLDAGSSPGQALLNTKQNKISQGRLVKSGMTECIVIPACLSHPRRRQVKGILPDSSFRRRPESSQIVESLSWRVCWVY